MESDKMMLRIRINEDIEFECEGNYWDVKAEREAFVELLPTINEIKLGTRIAFVRQEAMR